MKFSEYITMKRKEKNLSVRQLALYSEVSPGYLSQIENEKRSTPTPDIIKKLAKGLKVPYSELMEVAGYIESNKNDLPELTEKEERDVAKDLQDIIDDLESGTSLAFDGEPMDDDTRELVLAQIERNLRTTKKHAKKKFTPKKYRDNK
ncbi:helix-turn-helix domain-containing protein [Oceanobacillus sp. FSL W7-1281]|uniref:helix-turn-helix domain-containing protein n=1 Tax=Oceanobacillus sp. FSL W7-1281 TaxID=2921698 RepID=UPI0030DB3B78